MPAGVSLSGTHFACCAAVACLWSLVANPIYLLLESSGQIGTPYLAHDMRGRVVVVTGANAGIGKSIAAQLAGDGATVVMACRSMKRGEEAKREIEQELSTCSSAGRFNFLLDGQSYPHVSEGQLVVMELDLEDLKSVKMFADNFSQRYDRLDVLVNNAGISPASMGLDFSQLMNMNFQFSKSDVPRTKQGIERMFGVNYVAHFHLVQLLMHRPNRAPMPRIVNLASVMHRWASPDMIKVVTGDVEFNGYEDSKLAMIFFSAELQRRLAHLNVSSTAVNPGFVRSDIWRDIGGVPILGAVWGALLRTFALSPAQGAFTAVAAASNPFPQAPLYLAPYYYPDSLQWLAAPFEIGGPFIGSREATPRLPESFPEVSSLFWEETAKLLHREN